MLIPDACPGQWRQKGAWAGGAGWSSNSLWGVSGATERAPPCRGGAVRPQALGGTTPRLCSIREPTLLTQNPPLVTPRLTPVKVQVPPSAFLPRALWRAKWPPGPSVPLSFPVLVACMPPPSTAVFAKKVVLAERPPKFPLGGQALAAAARSPVLRRSAGRA